MTNNITASLLLLNAILLCIFDLIQCRILKKQSRRKSIHFDDVRPLMPTLKPGLEPSFYETEKMGVDEHGHFYYIMKGQGGGKRGIVCGITGKPCNEECFKKYAFYLTDYGEPLFFCRYFYCVFKGRRYVEYKVFDIKKKESKNVLLHDDHQHPHRGCMGRGHH